MAQTVEERTDLAPIANSESWSDGWGWRVAGKLVSVEGPELNFGSKQQAVYQVHGRTEAAGFVGNNWKYLESADWAGNLFDAVIWQGFDQTAAGKFQMDSLWKIRLKVLVELLCGMDMVNKSMQLEKIIDSELNYWNKFLEK